MSGFAITDHLLLPHVILTPTYESFGVALVVANQGPGVPPQPPLWLPLAIQMSLNYFLLYPMSWKFHYLGEKEKLSKICFYYQILLFQQLFL